MGLSLGLTTLYSYFSFLSELEYELLEKELVEKRKVASRVENQEKEVTNLDASLKDVKAQLETTTKALAREKGKARSASEHNEVRTSFFICCFFPYHFRVENLSFSFDI